MKIIRILFILLALLAVPRSWAAATAVSGIVDGEIWTTNGSPYSVGGDVIVSSLVIQPGVQVQFQGNYEFRVDGRLQVNGTTVSPVKFTSTNAAVGWQGILFFDSLPGSYFANCTIENAKNSAVRINNTQPVGGGVPAFTNCTILNNSSPNSGGGIAARLNSGDLIFQNCIIITIRILVPQHQLVTRGGSLILRADIGKQLSHRHLLKRVDAHNL